MLFKDLEVSFEAAKVPDSVEEVVRNQQYGPQKWERYDLYLPKGKEKLKPITNPSQMGS